VARKHLRRIQQLAISIGDSRTVDRGSVARLRDTYRALTSEERGTLFHWLASGLEIDRAALSGPIDRLVATPADDDEAWGRNLLELRSAIESPRRKVLGSLINVPGGMKFILELRAEILDHQRAGRQGLEAVEADIAGLLNEWFTHGFLFLEEIDRTSPFEKIRFLKERELVHPMLSLEEMGQRLGEDRLCFALCHVVMPDEPVVFIEVALSHGLVRSIHDIIDVGGPERSAVISPDTAIFYSINNTQEGLAGLGLGKVLVFRVTDALRARHPSLKTFATLSPIPGFWRRYLLPILDGAAADFTLSREELLDRFSGRAREALCARHHELGGEGEDLATVLRSVLDSENWYQDPVFERHLRRPLQEIVHHYLSQERDRGGRPLNAVASFHLGNGATLALRNVNVGANTSARGIDESCGVMVNYVYSKTTLQQLGSTVRALLPWVRSGR